MTKTLVFTECEHDGDLEVYKADLRRCGATILGSTIDPDEEECSITIEYDDWNDFKTKFKMTESYDFWILLQEHFIYMMAIYALKISK